MIRAQSIVRQAWQGRPGKQVVGVSGDATFAGMFPGIERLVTAKTERTCFVEPASRDLTRSLKPVSSGDLKVLQRGKSGRARPGVSPTSVRKKPTVLPDLRQPSAESKAPRDGHHTSRSYLKCSNNHYSSFCYEKKRRGERCVLCVSQPGVELWWWCNGSVIHQGEENRVEFQLSDWTAGIYLCFAKGANEFLLLHVVSIEEEGPCPQPLGKNQLTAGSHPPGKNQLFLPSNLECLSDACSDNHPVVCRDCTSRGTIFLDHSNAKSYSRAIGEFITLDTRVCQQELTKFDFMWNCNGQDLPSENHLSCTFRVTKTCSYVCLALNRSSKAIVKHSEVFMVTAIESPPWQQPLTDATVSTEVSPSQNHRVCSHPFPAQMACTSTPAASQLCTPRTPSVTSIPFRQLEQGFPSSFMSPILQATPQSEHDSEPAAMPSESQSVFDFLTNELVKSSAFKHPRFSLFTLACCRSCKASIRDIIQMVGKNFPYCSEEETLKRVIQLICQETALEGICIRRCTVLAYELICSLLDDAQNPYHHKLGAQLMQRAPFPPMLLKWGQGQPQCLRRGEFVRFFVKALNADRYEWIFNGASVGSASTYNFQVAPSTCGVYKCLVHNRHSTVATPPTRISMSDEPTGCSVTECMYETRFSVGIIPRPSTAIDMAPVEAEAVASFGSHDEMVVGSMSRPRTGREHAVPCLLSGDDRRGLMMATAGRDRVAPCQHLPRLGGRSPFELPPPDIRSSPRYNEYRPPSSRRH